MNIYCIFRICLTLHKSVSTYSFQLNSFPKFEEKKEEENGILRGEMTGPISHRKRLSGL